ncbi:MAG: protein kinase [Spirulinaceae cyanobacterium SM2_1_0]|nr:protein kinase [Spirulinaceae cyanobacterium SM2_1_0]
MAKVHPIAKPENEAESDAILYLKGNLSDEFEIIHNLEIRRNEREVFEIDMVIIGPQCVFVVDVKGTRGHVEVSGSRWYPDRREPFHSPVAKLRANAKALSSTISDLDRTRPLHKVHVHPAVMMMADDASLDDAQGLDRPYVIYARDRCADHFNRRDFIPQGRLQDIRELKPLVRRAICGKAAPKRSPCYGEWQVIKELDRSDRYTEYRAHHNVLGAEAKVRLRVYPSNLYASPEEQAAERQLIGTAFLALRKLPEHANILNVTHCFQSQSEDSWIIVTDDVSAQSLRQYGRQSGLKLDRKRRIIEEILDALRHLHRHDIIHRNLTPDTILVDDSGRTLLTKFDYARIGHRQGTIAGEIAAYLEADAIYQAPEVHNNPGRASQKSDLFAAGAIFYELLVGKPAFRDVEELDDCHAIFPKPASEINPNLAASFDSWLQKLCALEPENRHASADEALHKLTEFLDEQKRLDLRNLPVGHVIDENYRVEERLGQPGSFAVAYKVFNGLYDKSQVLKLVVSDRYSTVERLKQELKPLLKVSKHPHIVDFIHADQLRDGTPYLLLEFIDGKTVDAAIADGSLSIDDSIRIAQQTAAGLAHIHDHGIYHQDIKPENLFLTEQGVKIIDFNIAISDDSDYDESAGTRRYMPPKFKVRNASKSGKIDRDLYALSLTVYECVTGRYPFDAPEPPRNQLAPDPRQFVENPDELSEALVAVMLKAIAPKRADRFANAEAFLDALEASQAPAIAPEPQPAPVPILDIEPKPEPQPTPVAEPEPEPTPEPAPVLNTQPTPQPVVSAPPTPTRDRQASRQDDRTSLFSYLTHQPPAKPDPDRPIVLDPSGVYPIPSGYIAIRSEVEFLEKFDRSNSPYWIAGQRPCEWAAAWLHARKRSDFETLEAPRAAIADDLGDDLIPDTWNDEQILALASALARYPDRPVARLLADLSDSDPALWLAEPSPEQLATWLTLQLPEDARPLEQAWYRQHAHHPLVPYYQPATKLDTLRRWLGIAAPPIPDLGSYPLPVPDCLSQEFDTYWRDRFYRTGFSDLDPLNLAQLPGADRIAAQACQVLLTRPQWITRDRQTKLRAYLSPDQKRDLQRHQAPPQPAPLSPDADPDTALAWATQQYLPYRRWEIAVQQAPMDERQSDRLAESFADWLFQNYPALTHEPVDRSRLNYSVGSLVRDQSQSHPILWVVVDGLGWLDHQELLDHLTQSGQLQLTDDLAPRFSILPTKTEYAKWSLYAQQLPNHSTWTGDVAKGFDYPKGRRYSDRQVRQLHKDLACKKYAIYCWDTVELDELYHSHNDWQSLDLVKRSHVLEGIVKSIDHCFNQYPEPERLQVIIASDHGQMLGKTPQISPPPEAQECKGRMILGCTEAPGFVYLDPQRFGLPHDISVIKGCGYLNAYTYATDRSAIGPHGGLFPEEVVVGVSVLSRQVQRLPVFITVTGTGKPRARGELTVTINNTNPVALSDLALQIEELPAFRTGQPLADRIPAHQSWSTKLSLEQCPELPIGHDSKQLRLSGRLSFCYPGDRPAKTELSAESAITIEQIFSSGIENLDDFL